MLTSFYTLRHVAASLNTRISGWRITSLFTQEKDELVLAFAEQPVSLVICCVPQLHTLYLHPSLARAKRNSTEVLGAARGLTVASVSVVPGNRIVRIDLEGGYLLAAFLFGPQPNVALIDRSNTVIDSFKRGHPAGVDKLSRGTDDLIFDEVLLRETIAHHPASTLTAALKTAVPTFSGVLAREAAERAGLPATIACSQMRPEQQEELLSAIRGMLAGLLAPVPRLYTRSHGAPPIFSLIPLHLAKGHEETIVEDVHDAIRQTLNRSRSASFLDDQKSRTLSVLRQTIARTRRALDAMEDHTKNFARANDYEQSGSWLLAHLSIVGKGVPSVRRNEDGVDVEIPLDARLTPARNAERYFEKAKQARTALREAQVRRKALEHRLAVTEKLAASLHEVQSREMLKEYMSNYKSELSEIGIGPKGDSSPPVPFRIFTVDGGFEVWAGKSSTNNDLLTLKHARPNDLWFHARGSSGSHVILRRSTAHGEPGKKAREQAASIAAFYSKMRHAKMVPVAMTERKYVRKPKGSPPGTVVLEREKVIFAEPALPGGASE